MAFLVLTGIPGAGKTSIARALSQYFGVQWCDSDQLIVESAQLSIPEIFATMGEEEFRRIEQRTVRAAMAEFDGIVALGGGAVLSEITRKALKDQFVVYLTVSQHEAVRRIEKSPGTRPLFLKTKPGNVQEKLDILEKISIQRVPLYEEVASIKIDTTHKSMGNIVAEISSHYWIWRQSLQT